MLEVFGNAWAVGSNFDAVCVTTNGIVKGDGQLVMGRGIAKTCAQRYPQVPSLLGTYVTSHGNRVFNCGLDGKTGIRVVSFPTKHHFKDKSDIELIRTSAIQLVELVEKNGWSRILLPRPGCANGGLSWENDVKPVLASILDSRFYVISDNPEDIARAGGNATSVSADDFKTDKPENQTPTVTQEFSPSDFVNDVTEGFKPIPDKSEDDLVLCDSTALCVTGHRPQGLWGFHPGPAYQKLQNKMYDCIKQFHHVYGVKRCLSGMAQGVDQLFADVAQYIVDNEISDMTNELCIPFDGQEKIWRQQGMFSQAEYHRIKSKATSSVITSPNVKNGDSKSAINKALHDRNAYMVDRSAFVLGVYKGDINDISNTVKKSSGTLHCLRYAYSKGRKIVVINPNTLETHKINF